MDEVGFFFQFLSVVLQILTQLHLVPHIEQSINRMDQFQQSNSIHVF